MNELINYSKLEQNKKNIADQWNDKNKPFRYFEFDGILHPEAVSKILDEYPNVTEGEWDNKTYINQKNKFSKTKFGDDTPNLMKVFEELHSIRFLSFMEEITGISNLMADDDLFGGGLHQSVTGAFLDVHVDFNFHPKTKNHRRMNLIIYMNENWKKEYNGFLELWDMDKKKMIEYIVPMVNKCVVFETNEVSFHGHPKKLNTPPDISRKSLAIYYYTKDKITSEVAEEHNTIYVNTEGNQGILKNIKSGIVAFKERFLK